MKVGHRFALQFEVVRPLADGEVWPDTVNGTPTKVNNKMGNKWIARLVGHPIPEVLVCFDGSPFVDEPSKTCFYSLGKSTPRDIENE